MKPLVWFIHGAWATPLSFNWFKSQLREHEAVDVTYDSQTAVAKTVALLRERARAEQRPIHIVGHSLGGVIAASVAQAAPVRRVVTLASPFGGNSYASILRWFFASQLVADMCPHGEVLSSLNRDPPKTPTLSFVANPGTIMFGERCDGVVSVSSQKTMVGPTYVELPLNHFEVLLSEEITKRADTFLFEH